MPYTDALSLLTLNINNPSPERAERQLAWLAERDEQIFVLTETAPSRGCALLQRQFTGAGHRVVFPEPPSGERGVMIVSRARAEIGGWSERLDYLATRCASVTVATSQVSIEIVGLYVPSRDASWEKTERKRRFIDDFRTAWAGGSANPLPIVLGDLNVLEPAHRPHYSFFQHFEYDFYRMLASDGLGDAYRRLHPAEIEHSWVGRTGDGYRYDHAFVAAPLLDRLAECAYVHQPRLDRLSDHSALTVCLKGLTPELLPVSDPTSRDGDTLALF